MSDRATDSEPPALEHERTHPPATGEIDWARVELPDTWPDRAHAGGPLSLLRVLRHVMGNRHRVTVPEDLPGLEWVPRYVLQEFHGIPNGNFSNRITRGYASGFDFSMLGTMKRARLEVARRLAHCRSVIDLGCGNAKTAAAVRDGGVTDVWGLDVSPYMLHHAARDHAGIHFVQGLIENIPAPDQRFDGASVVFVFHEMPPRSVRQGLAEIARVLRPGGLLMVVEPSPLQMYLSTRELFRRFGWRGMYFQRLMQTVHEPFLKAWHRFDLEREAGRHGLVLEQTRQGVPLRTFMFHRTP